MAEFKLTNKAVADLNGIWEYTADKWSVKQADKYYRELMESCKWIAGNPTFGKLRTNCPHPIRIQRKQAHNFL